VHLCDLFENGYEHFPDSSELVHLNFLDSSESGLRFPDSFVCDQVHFPDSFDSVLARFLGSFECDLLQFLAMLEPVLV
jgi:hypothetical protein